MFHPERAHPAVRVGAAAVPTLLEIMFEGRGGRNGAVARRGDAHTVAQRIGPEAVLHGQVGRAFYDARRDPGGLERLPVAESPDRRADAAGDEPAHGHPGGVPTAPP